MNMLKQVNAEWFDQEVLKSDVPVLVEFYTTWCPGCRAMEPVLEKLSEEFQGRAKVVQVNVEEEQLLGAEYGIRAVPTVILFKKGVVRGGFTGGKSAAAVRQVLEDAVDKAA